MSGAELQEEKMKKRRRDKINCRFWPTDFRLKHQS